MQAVCNAKKHFPDITIEEMITTTADFMIARTFQEKALPLIDTENDLRCCVPKNQQETISLN